MRVCKEYNEDEIAVISPRFHIRPDKEHCVIYPFDPSNSGTWKTISAIEGIALTLLNGKRTLKEAAIIIADLYEIEVGKGEEVVKSLINHSNNSPGNEFIESLVLKNSSEKFTQYPTVKFIQRLKCHSSDEKTNTSKLEVPLNLLFMPTNTCEVECVYCYSEKRHIPRDQYLSIKRWCEIIDESCELGIDVIIFSGGDPLTYLGIENILERLALNKMKFLLPTKSFISKEYAKRLSDKGICDMAVMQVSIDGISSSIDNLIKPTGYVSRALASIENLIKHGFYTRTNTVCTPLNVYEIPELIRKLHSMGVKFVNVTNYSRTFYRHNDSLFLNPKQIEWLNNEINKVKEELRWEELKCNAGTRDFSTMLKEDKIRNWENRSHCSGGTSSMAITPDGKVILCEQVPQKAPFVVGNVKIQGIFDIWNSPELETFIHPEQKFFKYSICGDCTEFNDCHQLYGRCFRDALFTFGSLYAPSPNCPRAPAGLRMS